MTSQSTYKELAPKHTARKVPVSQGRECQRETARRGPQYRRRCNMQSNRAGLSLSQHHSNVMGVRTRTLTGRGLLCLCLLHTRTLHWSLGELQFLTTACTVADFDLSQFTCGSLEVKANSALRKMPLIHLVCCLRHTIISLIQYHISVVPDLAQPSQSGSVNTVEWYSCV